jgi:magnesium-transporting ATPase (P-type)
VDESSLTGESLPVVKLPPTDKSPRATYVLLSEIKIYSSLPSYDPDNNKKSTIYSGTKIIDVTPEKM